MKYIYLRKIFLLFAICFLCNAGIAGTPSSPGGVTMLSPQNSFSYINTIYVSYSLTFTPKSTQIVFTYTGGYYTDSIGKVWTLNISGSATKGAFSFNPSTDTSSSNPFTVSPFNTMPDGYYTVYTQAINSANVTIRSSSVTKVFVSTHTWPGAIISPGTDTSVLESFLLYDSIPEAASLGSNSREIIFSGAAADTLIMLNTLKKDSFNLNINNITTSSANIVSASSNTIPDGVYNISLIYSDLYGHPSDTTTVNNVSISSVILAVTIVQFNGVISDGQTNLHWETLSESNTAFFDIQFSTDGKNYTSIGSMPAAGFSGGNKAYSFIHAYPVPGNNYYQLKVVNKDGSFQYSKVIMLKGNVVLNAIRVFPNPVQEQLQISIIAKQPATNLIRIFDAAGRLLKSQEATLNSGNNLVEINVGDLHPDIYLLQCGTTITRFVKQ